MEPEKQVSVEALLAWSSDPAWRSRRCGAASVVQNQTNSTCWFLYQREIASKGGRASRRSSEEGKVAGEGGRKRGRPRKGPSSLEEYEDIFV
jgi:hypothetical protein